MPTTNPVPSGAPQDLLYNAPQFDKFMTSDEETYTNRLGVEKPTLSSLQRDFPNAQANMQTSLQAAGAAEGYAVDAADAAVNGRILASRSRGSGKSIPSIGNLPAGDCQL